MDFIISVVVATVVTPFIIIYRVDLCHKGSVTLMKTNKLEPDMSNGEDVKTKKNHSTQDSRVVPHRGTN